MCVCMQIVYWSSGCQLVTPDKKDGGGLIRSIGCICPLSIEHNVEGKAYNIHGNGKSVMSF